MSSGAPLSEMRQAVLERRASNAGGTYYASYLKVDELLSLQQPKTAELCGGVAAHEEMLCVAVACALSGTTLDSMLQRRRPRWSVIA